MADLYATKEVSAPPLPYGRGSEKGPVGGCGYRAARVSKRSGPCASIYDAVYGGLVLPDTAGVRCGRAQAERRLSYCQERVKKSWGHACAHR